MYLFSFRVGGKKSCFSGKMNDVKMFIFCFKFSFCPLPDSQEKIRESAMKDRNISMASITKIFVTVEMLSLKPF